MMQLQHCNILQADKAEHVYVPPLSNCAGQHARVVFKSDCGRLYFACQTVSDFLWRLKFQSQSSVLNLHQEAERASVPQGHFVTVKRRPWWRAFGYPAADFTTPPSHADGSTDTAYARQKRKRSGPVCNTYISYICRYIYIYIFVYMWSGVWRSQPPPPRPPPPPPMVWSGTGWGGRWCVRRGVTFINLNLNFKPYTPNPKPRLNLLTQNSKA